MMKPNLIYNVARRTLYTTPRNLAYWNKDWKPATFPKTEEEKERAAKKYNLFREEYVPSPDDGHGSGDYPHFKEYSVESRDPFYPWDFPEYRRNFGEALHEDINLYGEDRYHVSMKPRYSLTVMAMAFLAVMGASTFLTYICKDTAFLPMMPQHMPKDGVKHYTYDN